jgi:hypothetical protein
MTELIASLLLVLSPQDQDEKIKQVMQELTELKKRVEALEQTLAARDQRVKELKEELDVVKMETEAAAKPQEQRPTPPNLLNPAITVFGNMAGRIDSKSVVTPDGDEVDDHMFLRSAELDFRAAVDPYADAVGIFVFEQEADGEFHAELEEGYVVIKRLPILEEAPLGMRLKAGKFRPPFGISNTTHLHDLMWTTRPEAVVRYLGTEGGSFFESGWSDVGAGVNFRLPDALTPEGTAVDIGYYAMDPGSIAVADGNDSSLPGHLARALWTIDLDPGFDALHLGASFYHESGLHPIDLYGLDVMFQHKPNTFESVVVGGELLYADRRFDDGLGTTLPNTPLGAYAFVQYQPDKPWYLGVRYDYVEDVDDDDLESRILGAYVSYYTSEFLRFRIGFEHRWSDVPEEDDNNTFMFELNWVYGEHPTEPFWVNR